MWGFSPLRSFEKGWEERKNDMALSADGKDSKYCTIRINQLNKPIQASPRAGLLRRSRAGATCWSSSSLVRPMPGKIKVSTNRRSLEAYQIRTFGRYLL